MTAATRLGILMMVATMATFAVQDGLSRYLAETYNTPMVVAFRYWVFAAYVIALALRRPEGFRAAVQSRQLGLHVLRGALLVIEIAAMIWAYTLIGLIESHAIFAACPLFVVALSGPVLGEELSRQRLIALAIGFAGVMIILRPGSGLFTWHSLLPLATALEKLEAMVHQRPMEVRPATSHLYIVNPILGGLGALFRTHPETAKRVAKLRAMANPAMAGKSALVSM